MKAVRSLSLRLLSHKGSFISDLAEGTKSFQEAKAYTSREMPNYYPNRIDMISYDSHSGDILTRNELVAGGGAELEESQLSINIL